MSPLLIAKGISKSFDGRKVLENLSVEIFGSEVLGIWGPNGCGKTTLIRIIGGLEEPDAGTGIIWCDEGTTIGYVSQNADNCLLPWYSVQQNLRYAHSKERWNKGGAQSIFTKFHFDERDLVKLPGKMSGGQRQRLALACAIARESKCLLLDEPFSGLDIDSLGMVVELIRETTRSGSGILLVTHDPEAAILASDRIIVLNSHSNQPTRIADEIRIELPHRVFSEVTSETFVKYRNRLLLGATAKVKGMNMA